MLRTTKLRKLKLRKLKPRELKPSLYVRSIYQSAYDALQGSRQPIGLIVGGLLMGISPVNAWALAWVAMIPLWWAVRRSLEAQKLRPAIVGACLWGLAYHGSALSWITGIHPITWLGLTWLESFLAIVVFAWLFITVWGAAIAIAWAVSLCGVYRIVQKVRERTSSSSSLLIVSYLLTGTSLWCAIEWLWSQGPLYWSSLSYTQSPGNLWLLQLGQLSGPTTITATVVAVNGLLAEAWLNRFRLRPKRLLLASAIALFISLHLAGWSLYVQPLVDNPAAAVAVGLVQGNIPTNRKLTSAGIQEARNIYLQGYQSLVAAGADIVVTPEGAIPQRWNAFLQSQDLLQRAVNRSGVPLVLGTFVREDIDDNTTPITQSLLTLTTGNEVFGRYKKVKLVPLGEYLPFENILSPIIGGSPFGTSMVPGNFNQQLKTPFGPFATGICYESAFSRLFRQQVHSGGQIILTASNNDPYPPRQMKQHHAHDVMRAIETNRWEVRVTNTGISSIVDPKGRSQWLSTPNQRTTHLSRVYRRTTQTLYVRYGDWLTPLLIGLSAIALTRLHATNSANSTSKTNPTKQ